LAAAKVGMDGVVVLNKTDLGKPGAHDKPTAVFQSAGYTVVPTSAKTGDGLDDLRECVRLKTSLFVGHSGVGKSSLLNTLEPGLGLRTRQISEATGKGAHTTTSIQLHQLSFGGYIVDTPGLKVIGLWDLSPEELPELYPEFEPHLGQCRFNNCIHVGEPGCAIKGAVETGEISEVRYEGYVRIRQTLIQQR
jgi:ribosome biogenesis GTPase